jgi:hypothetical protein
MLRNLDWYLPLPTFRDNLSVLYSRVRPPKVGPICCPETSVATNLRYVTSQKSKDLKKVISMTS